MHTMPLIANRLLFDSIQIISNSNTPRHSTDLEFKYEYANLDSSSIQICTLFNRVATCIEAESYLRVIRRLWSILHFSAVGRISF